jgi:hypothetical protein
MRRWPAFLPLALLLGCSEGALAPDETDALAPDPRLVFRVRQGRFLCGLPPDENGLTCRFVPADESSPEWRP